MRSVGVFDRVLSFLFLAYATITDFSSGMLNYDVHFCVFSGEAAEEQLK